MFRSIATLMLLPLVTSCATPANEPLVGEKSLQNRFGNAIISPLNDLNLVQTSIPIVVQDALKNPYQIPINSSCDILSDEIIKLDAALGPDVDTLALSKREKTYSEKGQEFIQNEAVNSVERTISSFIPFRGWIRKITGAESHSKEVMSAITAGLERRAFLKGIGQAEGCKPPAAPTPIPLTPTIIPAIIPAATPSTILTTNQNPDQYQDQFSATTTNNETLQTVATDK